MFLRERRFLRRSVNRNTLPPEPGIHLKPMKINQIEKHLSTQFYQEIHHLNTLYSIEKRKVGIPRCFSSCAPESSSAPVKHYVAANRGLGNNM